VTTFSRDFLRLGHKAEQLYPPSTGMCNENYYRCKECGKLFYRRDDCFWEINDKRNLSKCKLSCREGMISEVIE